MKTVYVEITDNYSRTVWDNTGATNYVASDRVEYNDGSQNIIFVCITDNNSTTTPDVNTSDWVEAGSEKYPFLVSSAISTTNFCNLDETTSSLGEYALYSSGTNFAVEAAGSQGEIILGDGEYRWTRTKGASYIHPNFNNVNIKAKNQLKAYIRGHFTQYNNCAKAENLVLVNEYTLWNYVFGRKSSTPSSLIGCLITQETPTFKLQPVKQEPSSGSQSRPIEALATGSIIKNCAFDFSYFGPSYWFNTGNTLITVENNTFYARVKHNQYVAVQSSGGSVFKNNIFYYKYLNDSHLNQNFHSGMTSQGTNILYVENPVSAAGGSIANNIPDGQTINPLFIDADNGNFSLRPSSPLIGGAKSENVLSNKYPEGMWFDANHVPVSQTYNFSLDAGDGNNYTFSGDATGTDPAIEAGTGDTLIFTNNTGGHPIGIEDPDGNVIATESNGTLSFSTLTEGTYRYVCTAPHPNMSNTITITRNVGGYNNPSNDFLAALGASYTLLIKEGTHALTRKIIDMPGADLKIIGESTEKSVLVFSGGNYGGAISSAYIGDSSSLSFESLTFLWDGTQNAFGIILCNDLNVKSCIFAQTENHLNSASYTRGWFAGPDNAGNTAVIKNSIIRGKSDNALVFGGDHFQNSFNKATISNCTMICDGVVTENFYGASNSVGLASAQSFTLNNTLHVGFSGTELLNSSAPINGGNNYYYNTGLSTGVLDGDLVSTEPPGFVSENDLRLRPNSRLIGGIKKNPTNIYYLQPGNPLNGDGSQKDASSMTADGDPGPFNAFKNIVAAGVPYGSKVIILNGTYSWPSEFIRKNSSIWQDHTYEGYNYEAETFNEVIFDANRQSEYLGYIPYGGTPGAGQILDLDTSFTGIQFNNVVGTGELTSRNQIFTSSSSAGFGSCTFNNCKFLGWINIGAYQYPWTGGGRSQYGSTMHWKGCVISIAFDYAGGLLSGGDGFASDAYHGAWSWENCTFYIPVGLTTFNGRNAANGTYQSPSILFGSNYNQSQRIFKNNIIYIPGGSTSTGTTTVNNLPSIKNNCFVGVVPRSEYFDFINDNNLLDVDPKFINPENNNFKLRPNSLLVGRGA